MTEPRPSVPTALSALLAGLLLGAGAFAGCQPGTLPCDNPDWANICDGGVTTAGGTSGNGGMPSGNGGSSGSGGGMSMAGGMMGTGNPPPTAATLVANCTAYPNLGEMDKFFAMRCGTSASCHDGAGASVWNDLKSAEVWRRAPDLKAKFDCTGNSLADTTEHTKSVLWTKVQDPPKCPDGSAPKGVRMPMMVAGQPAMFLSQAEMTCLEGFLKAIKK